MKTVYSEILRFVVSGGLNTLATYALYLCLLQFASYSIAYTAAFFIGILIAYFLNTVFVFRTTHTAFKATLFPLVYAVQYLLNILILHITVDSFALSPKIALAISIVISLPITFGLGRLILKQRDKHVP